MAVVMAELTITPAAMRMTALIECLCLEVNDVAPLCYCGPYFGGDTPLDWCADCGSGACGQAWVRLVQSYPSSAFPDPDTSGNCAMPLAYEWEVGVARCAPTSAADGTPPSRDANVAAAALQYADMEAMRRAVACCFAGADVDYILGSYTPAVVLGGCNAAVWQVWSR